MWSQVGRRAKRGEGEGGRVGTKLDGMDVTSSPDRA